MRPAAARSVPVLTGGQGALAALFAVSGSLHLVRPQIFEPIVPRVLPAPRALVHLSGLAELGCAAGLAYPPTRRAAGAASAALLVAVLPANVQMALVARRRGSAVRRVVTAARVPMQLPMIRTALRAGR